MIKPKKSSKVITNMTSKASARIQSNTDRKGTNQGFKARAQSAAARRKAK